MDGIGCNYGRTCCYLKKWLVMRLRDNFPMFAWKASKAYSFNSTIEMRIYSALQLFSSQLFWPMLGSLGYLQFSVAENVSSDLYYHAGSCRSGPSDHKCGWSRSNEKYILDSTLRDLCCTAFTSKSIKVILDVTLQDVRFALLKNWALRLK